ncbi:hypothetical protein GHL01_04100 [Sinorhizobium meliloti]|uniref:hypothetical protein n=1 Tax=Rhizobium meliloti TaxID=382 RepID=UPI00129494DE|nr:hypothetical protein [Sinorhizobium meliloti]MDW9689294.1 hypothetical protein [Sinorhizobium meliloti]MQV12925.1 hypothetical protein [Sinorhizobium meliloti]
MDEKFRQRTERLHEKYELLMRSTPVRDGVLTSEFKGSGVYTFTEDGKVIYVGRTRDVRKRYAHHTQPGSGQNKAVLAFKFAKKNLNIPPPTYKSDENTRNNLMLNAAFLKEFSKQKERLKSMEFRFIEECDAISQALLEIYVSEVSESPHNDFNTT